MELLGKDGRMVTKTAEEIKMQEEHLKAKIMASARKKGIQKAEFKGYIKGEPIFGEPLDGFTPEALGLLEKIAQDKGKPSLATIAIPQPESKDKPTLTKQQEFTLDAMMPEEDAPTTKGKIDTKSIFGF